MRWIVCLTLLMSIHISAAAKSKPVVTLKANPAWVEKELTKMGFSKGFVKESVKHYDTQSFDRVVTLNLLGFLNPPGQHLNHITPRAVNESSKFIQENQKYFQLAKEKYQVPPHVISSLLWIETRHGGDMGSFHTVSVYLHLLQSDLKKNRQELVTLALQKNKKMRKYSKKALRTLMAERTKKKADWAREQLIALAASRKEKHLDLTTLKGSYAGAFGLPQFIPSSYRSYAKAVKPKETPDLTQTGDAILSVANYLHKHGWRTRKAATKVEALMKYNNSRDYADSILEISKRVTSRTAAAQDTGLAVADDK